MAEALIELAGILSPLIWTCGGGAVLIGLISWWVTA